MYICVCVCVPKWVEVFFKITTAMPSVTNVRRVRSRLRVRNICSAIYRMFSGSIPSFEIAADSYQIGTNVKVGDNECTSEESPVEINVFLISYCRTMVKWFLLVVQGSDQSSLTSYHRRRPGKGSDLIFTYLSAPLFITFFFPNYK